eukprot:tig00020509_g9763.t1
MAGDGPSLAAPSSRPPAGLGTLLRTASAPGPGSVRRTAGGIARGAGAAPPPPCLGSSDPRRRQGGGAVLQAQARRRGIGRSAADRGELSDSERACIFRRAVYGPVADSGAPAEPTSGGVAAP